MSKFMLSVVAAIVLVVAGNAQVDSSELLWHNATTGELSAWVFDSHGNVTRKHPLSWRCDAASGCARDWEVVGTQVFRTDYFETKADILWHNATTGELSAWWLAPDGTVIRKHPLSWKCDTASGCARDWKVVGTGNLSVLWHNATTGELSAWSLAPDGTVEGKQPLSWKCDTASGCARDWKVVGMGDFNSDVTPDVLWYNATTGELSAWLLDSHGNVTGKQPLSWKCDAASGCARDWKVVGVGDFNSDGTPHVLWYNATTGELSAWLLDSHGNVTGKQPLSWKCDAASGCARDWKPVGIIRYYPITIN
jgi:hypothetical protein